MKLVNGYAPNVVVVASLLILAASIYFIWCIAIDGVFWKPPVTYWDGCFGVTKKVYHAGEYITVRGVMTKTRDFPGVVQWSLVNYETREVTNFQPRQAVVMKGYHDITVKIAMIPDGTHSGTYFMSGTAVYDVNAFRSIPYHMQTDLFEIAASREADGE